MGALLAAMIGSWLLDGAVVSPSPGALSGEPRVVVLCYHEVAADPRGRIDTVHPDALRAHVRALKASGWQFATVSQLESFRDRAEELPKRVVVLTFDDGLESFYRVVLPMLREEQVPATLAVVPSFLDAPPADLPAVMSWEQLAEVAQSGWVEIASHTQMQHELTAGNPFGTLTPAVTTREYLADAGRYEDRAEYRARIADDLATSKRTLEERLGVTVRSLAWPYGEHNALARKLAEEAGFAVTMGLNGGPATVQDLQAGFLERLLVTRGADIGDADLTRWLVPDPNPVFAANVDLDDLYDEDPQRLVANVEATIRQLWRLGATHVFLKGCSDPKGIGYLESAYFMNHQAPVRADVWGMVAGRMKRAGLRVWMRAPALNLTWEWERHPEWRVQPGSDAGTQLTVARYFRLSPDSEAARRAATDFFNDVAVYAPIDGILFDEDAFVTSSEELATLAGASSDQKAQAIETYLDEVRRTVRAWRPLCRFGRVVSAEVVAAKGTDEMTAQSYASIAAKYDLTVVPVPGDLDAKQARKLASRALSPYASPAEGARRVLFSLPADDNVAPVLTGMRQAGGVNFGVRTISSQPNRLWENFFRAAVDPSAMRTVVTTK